ncbi:MAG: hypothetical protein D3910_26810 [Candidatus Electrothrix sp. ATG2]|nr:hypothetical protein [Candidatus Electrothrix sp. ATG2]
MQAHAAKTEVFNPDWGIDIQRILTPIRIPAVSVVEEALNLYQTAFRKPSLIAYLLDYSGSMQGEGVEQLKKAMRTLLDQEIAKKFLLQTSSKDVTLIQTMLEGSGISKDIPVFTILFGKAKKEQMQELAESMSGRMFDGRADVVKAFREAKGYN